jgi:hypothetical protein
MVLSIILLSLRLERSLGKILAELNLAVESGIENVEANRLAFGTENLTAQIQANRNAAANAVAAPIQQINQGPIYSPPSQSEADIRTTGRSRCCKIYSRQETQGNQLLVLGRPLDNFAIHCPNNPKYCRRLNRSLTD